MKIAIPYEDGAVYPHFGHAAAFLICRAENGSVTEAGVVETQGRGTGR